MCDCKVRIEKLEDLVKELSDAVNLLSDGVHALDDRTTDDRECRGIDVPIIE